MRNPGPSASNRFLQAGSVRIIKAVIILMMMEKAQRFPAEINSLEKTSRLSRDVIVLAKS